MPEADENKISIDPIVALTETAEKAAADDAYYRNRCLLLAQRNHLNEQTIAALKAEIERLTAKLGEATGEKKTEGWQEMERAKTSPAKTVLLANEKKKAS